MTKSAQFVTVDFFSSCRYGNTVIREKVTISTKQYDKCGWVVMIFPKIGVSQRQERKWP